MNDNRIVPPRLYSSYHAQRFLRWQNEYDRLSDEEARLRNRLKKTDDQMGLWVVRLNEIQARQTELQALMERRADDFSD